jgi:hypothetical protein
MSQTEKVKAVSLRMDDNLHWLIAVTAAYQEAIEKEHPSHHHSATYEGLRIGCSQPQLQHVQTPIVLHLAGGRSLEAIGLFDSNPEGLDKQSVTAIFVDHLTPGKERTSLQWCTAIEDKPLEHYAQEFVNKTLEFFKTLTVVGAVAIQH